MNFTNGGRRKTPHPDVFPGNEPIRSELFSIERLEQHAQSLAEAQIVSTEPSGARALRIRLAQNEKALEDGYRKIAAATREGRAIPPAAEWLLDNYHIVQEQMRQIRDDLPPKYYRRLPKLAGGHLKGYPRVFGIA